MARAGPIEKFYNGTNRDAVSPADRRFRRHSADSDFLPFVGGAAGPQSGSESLRLVKLDHYSKAYSAIPDTVYRSYRKAELICQLNPVIQSSGSLQALAN